MSSSFGEIVKRRRSALGMTQARLGDLVGRSISTVRAWERDRTHPSDDETLAAVVAVLGITDDELTELDLVLPGGRKFRPAGPGQPTSRADVTAPEPPATRVVGTGSSTGPGEPIRRHGSPDVGPADPRPAAGAAEERSTEGAEEPATERLFDEDALEVESPEGAHSEEAQSEEAQSEEAQSEEAQPEEAEPEEAEPEEAEPEEAEPEETPSGEASPEETPSADAEEAVAGLPKEEEPKEWENVGDVSGESFGAMEQASVDLDARTTVMEDGGIRVLGVGTSAAALRPAPLERPEPEEGTEDAEAEESEAEESGGEETEGEGPEEPQASPDEDDPFAATQVAEPPVVAPAPTAAITPAARAKPADTATALGGLSRSTMALERRPSPTKPSASPVVENYLDDPDEERRYRVRAVLTFAAMIGLLIFLRWALGGMGEAIGQLWSNFQENLKI